MAIRFFRLGIFALLLLLASHHQVAAQEDDDFEPDDDYDPDAYGGGGGDEPPPDGGAARELLTLEDFQAFVDEAPLDVSLQALGRSQQGTPSALSCRLQRNRQGKTFRTGLYKDLVKSLYGPCKVLIKRTYKDLRRSL